MLTALLLGAPVKLAIVAQVGSAFSFNVTMSMKGVGGGGSMRADLVIKETVTKKEGSNLWWDSIFKVAKVDGVGDLLQVGSALRQMEGHQIAYLRDPQNKVIKAKVDGTVITGNLFGATSNITYPATAIDKGATWKASLDIGGTSVPIAYRFEGPTSYAGKPAYHVTGAINSPTAKSIKAYTFYLDRANCVPLFAEGTVRLTSRGATIEASFTIKRRK